MNAKYSPLKVHEAIMVFCKGKSVYYPIMKSQPMRKKGKKSKLWIIINCSVQTKTNDKVDNTIAPKIAAKLESL